MKKIAALIEKLQELKTDEAALNEMAYYTQLLYAELMCVKNASDKQSGPRKKVSVIMPQQASPVMSMENPSKYSEKVAREGKVPAEMAVNAETTAVRSAGPSGGKRFQGSPIPQPVYRDAEEVGEQAPGWLAMPRKRKEINEVIAEQAPSLNDKLKEQNMELVSRLSNVAPVKDLCKAIGVNDKFIFINELFRGDGNMFDRSVKTINECGSLKEAEYWMGRELRIKLGWQEKNEAVQQFYYLVKKRFS
jgi:hypothetical protein